MSLLRGVPTDIGPGPHDRPGAGVPLARLHALRAGYLLVVVGLAVTQGPSFVQDSQSWPLMAGVVHCVLAAVWVLALLGIRYPLRMLPLVLFEIAWKLIWLAVVALPQWAAGTMDQATWDVAFSCLFVVVLLAVVPWRHVAAHYGTGRGDPWRPVRED
ncbi:hypothetical protein SAMN05660464_0894 [Geodermatophilus dictyosporus]|uniref:Uncharacterized protein n=1 Tax=Geodermatophilus dictyosporus TaxID=1523247 RepID=A0A1I5JN70_9ACTN|nr:hypothetical protein [Geodermatophilus dictyosporus]SFO74254.1 hypothetical protein SAMN05660464_0894 [Geodermatophilus dictyosporus]